MGATRREARLAARSAGGARTAEARRPRGAGPGARRRESRRDQPPQADRVDLKLRGRGGRRVLPPGRAGLRARRPRD
ncbi:retroelement silencing factor 1 isoform X3 [Manis javanica]|uniref:retroelement silencing factor 1 isoform X3 n=1 Tax=Manis javanica TaxID=9974 RepID=UPI003C6D493A